MSSTRIILILFMVISLFAFVYFDLQQFLTLDTLKSQQTALLSYWHTDPVKTIAGYCLIYIIVTGLSLPGATILTLAGGALFGLFWGTVIVSFASTIGATLAFLVARFLLRERVTHRFSDRLSMINNGIAKEGAFYLFTLRLVPLFPFFMINLLMGLTTLKTHTFYWVSQLGMLAGTMIYVNAGTQLTHIDSLTGILSPKILISFILMGLFPLLAKWLVSRIKQAKVYAQWQKPKSFETNLIVIGAGSGGLVTAFIAAAVKAKITLVENHKMGGDCLNTGCVPSKALICTTRFLAEIKQAQTLGIHTASADFSFDEIMERVQTVIKQIEPHDSVERYTRLGVDVVEGRAKIISPWTVEVTTAQGTRLITTRSIVIAAGAKPFIPPIPGLDGIDYLTSDTVWRLRDKPERLLVLGGGPIGCELAQAFARLGVSVTQVERQSRIMIREDEEVSAAIMEKFEAEGIQVLVEHTAQQFIIEKGEKILLADYQGRTIRIIFDQVLLAIGRSANVSGYGVEALNIELSAKKTLVVNPFMETNYPNIYACGDVVGPYQFTHMAAHQAWYATVNALFGTFKKFRTDYSIIPWAIFTDPEIARVGLNEQEAKQQGIAYEVSRYNMDDLDRAIADSHASGFIKVLTPPGKDKILGVTIVGAHAGDLIAEFILAMKHGLGLNKLLGTIHIYPTLSEANKYVAGVWKRNHAPQKLLQWVTRYHTWRRR